MSLKTGIVGLPNVGKSTLFNALTESRNAEASNYPFCTIEPNMGTIIVPDKRMDEMLRMYNSKKVVPSTIEFVDIAGLVKGASKGEGLGNQFLSHIKEIDAIIHIVRCFEDDNVIHVNNKVDPASDIETVETELILKDIDSLEKRIERISKSYKTGDKKVKKEFEVLEGLKSHFAQSRLARYYTLTLDEEGKEIMKTMQFLTDVPILYVANTDENSVKGNKYSQIVKDIAEKEGATFLNLSVQIEYEIANLGTKEEKMEFITDLGLEESGLSRLIRKSYKLLELITFYTVNEKELHSWTIQRGTKAPQAAGKIHTDIERGFIRAEIMKYKDLIELGSEQLIKEKGLLHIEGKDYVIEDGDITYFRFNV
jgi:ribosome-binding ATPase